MCDTYEMECSNNCKRIIQVHIADFCVPRDTIKAYCPICTQKMLQEGTKIEGKIFIDNALIDEYKMHMYFMLNDEIRKVFKKKSGEDYNMNFEIMSVSMLPDDKIENLINPVLFVCSDEKGYGIHLN